ncbi:hypothetical protein D1872_320180 [compost metagenome]
MIGVPFHTEAEFSLDQQHVTNLAFSQPLSHLTNRLKITCPHRFHEEELLLLGNRQHLFQLRTVHRNRLLAED